MLSKLIKGSVNVFRISETKLDDGFPEGSLLYRWLPHTIQV